MIVDERRSRLLELVRSKGFASLPELMEELEVSESTVRRDLDYLEETGAAKRTHGGVFYTGPSPKLPHFDERQPAHWDKKRPIARGGSRLIEDGDTILLDGGSTTYEVAQLLVGRPLQIVTNSLPVANLFASQRQHGPGAGGRLRLPADRRVAGAVRERDAGRAERAADRAERGGHQRARVLQQQPAAGRNRAGDDASRRRGDRRRRQHEVRPPEPGAPVRRWADAHAWSSTTRSAPTGTSKVRRRRA